jgi:hypothetical protein
MRPVDPIEVERQRNGGCISSDQARAQGTQEFLQYVIDAAPARHHFLTLTRSRPGETPEARRLDVRPHSVASLQRLAFDLNNRGFNVQASPALRTTEGTVHRVGVAWTTARLHGSRRLLCPHSCVITRRDPTGGIDHDTALLCALDRTVAQDDAHRLSLGMASFVGGDPAAVAVSGAIPLPGTVLFGAERPHAAVVVDRQQGRAPLEYLIDLADEELAVHERVAS